MLMYWNDKQEILSNYRNDTEEKGDWLLQIFIQPIKLTDSVYVKQACI